MKDFVISGSEQVLARHPNAEWFCADELKLEGLLDLLRLKQGWMRAEVRKYQTVDAELPIVYLIAEVAAVCPEMPTVFGFAIEPLIDPIPNKPALQSWLGSKRIPIIFEIPK